MSERPTTTPAHSFRTELTVWFGAVVAALLVTVAAVGWVRMESLHQESEDRLLRTLADSLAESVHRISFSGRYHAGLLLEDLVEQDPELVFMEIRTFDGDVYARAGAVPEPVSAGPLSAPLATVDDLRIARVPFRQGYLEEEIGVLEIGVSRAQHHAASRTTGVTLLLFCGLLLGLGVATVHGVSKRLAGPVEDLAAEFGGILEHAPLGVAIEDGSGRLVRASDGLLRQVGWTGAPPAGLHELLGLPAAEHRRELQRLTAAGAAPLQREQHVTPPDGRERVLAVTQFPLKPEFESGLVCTLAVDRTAQRELELRLSQIKRLESIGQFAGGVAHDFNNILTGIIGLAELIKLDASATADTAIHAEGILDQCARASDLTRRILSFGRRQILVLRSEDLGEVVAGSRSFLQRVLPAKIAFEVHDPDGPLPVRIDRGQVDQVLLNLVANARDAIGPRGRIEVRCTRALEEARRSVADGLLEPGSYAVLEVRDDGPGIPADVRPRLFDPFVTSKRSGTGLGLSIVQGVLARHRGAIDVETSSEGTVFRCYFPLEAAPIAAQEQAPAATAPARALVILLAEDDPQVREHVARLLEGWGHTVTACADGEEAVESFLEHPDRFDLAVLDVIMPGLHGGEVFRRLRGQRPDLPALFVTGYDDRVLQSILELEPGVRVLGKPFAPEDLAEGIAALTAREVTSPAP